MEVETRQLWGARLLFIVVLFWPRSFFALGTSKQEAKSSDDLQARYEKLPEIVPAMVMLRTAATSIVEQGLVEQIDRELSKQLVSDSRIKPVTMEKWLASSFYEKKTTNIFALLNAVQDERYPVLLRFVCKPTLFKSDNYYVLSLSFYPLAGAHYPVTVLRLFEKSADVPKLISASLAEAYQRLFNADAGQQNRKRIVVQGFKLDLIKLVELDSKEFDYIPVPFIPLYNNPLRVTDDYFSIIMAYILSTTDLVQVMRLTDIADFSDASGIGTAQADYSLQGRVQLSEQRGILYVDLRDLKTNTVIKSVRHPLHDFSLRNIWNIYRKISVEIVSAIATPANFGVFPTLEASGRGFFSNSMFVGWDKLENVVMPRGMQEIRTGTYFRAGEAGNRFSPSRGTDGKSVSLSYFMLFDTIDQLFTGRDGEYLQKLLKQ